MSRTLLASLVQRLMATTESMPSTDGMEREYVFFGQMVDKIDLEKADSFCDQEQYRILVPAKEKGREISVRIRKTVSWYRKQHEGANGVEDAGLFMHDPVYHLTIKSFLKGEEGCAEAENELATEAGGRMLDIFRENGSDGLIKRRYVFPVGSGFYPTPEEHADERVNLRGMYRGLVWEVDVPKEFPNSDDLTRSEVGDGNSWVKLDLEVKGFDWKLTDDSFQLPFPIRLKNVIYQQPGKRDKETEAKVKKALDGMRTRN
jgi:hypothetical protein